MLTGGFEDELELFPESGDRSADNPRNMGDEITYVPDRKRNIILFINSAG